MSKKTEYINKYNKTHYDRINMFIPKGYKEQIKDRAKGLGIGMNDYIFQLILNDLNGVSSYILLSSFLLISTNFLVFSSNFLIILAQF